MRADTLKILLVVPFLLAVEARGGELSPRGTADVEDRGGWSVGVFSPLRLAFRDGMEVEIHPLVAFAAPHATLRVRHGELFSFRLAGEYGLLVPTPAMRLMKGFFFPEWEMSEADIGWFVVPHAALVASTGDLSVMTLKASISAGIPLGQNDAIPLDSYAPVDLLLAPMLQGFRARVGVGHDHPLTSSIRLRGGIDIWLVGKSPQPPRSPLFLSARVGIDVGLGETMRLALGAAWFNSDQRRTVLRVGEDGFLERHPRRSNDFFPSLDLIWQR